MVFSSGCFSMIQQLGEKYMSVAGVVDLSVNSVLTYKLDQPKSFYYFVLYTQAIQSMYLTI